MPEEYEIVPHESLNNIKKELDILKKKADSQKTISAKSFRASIESLNKNVNGLLSLFKEAAETMKTDNLKEEPSLKEQLDPVMQKLDVITEENRKIAQGILVVADLVKGVREGEKKIEKKIETRQVPPPRIVQARPPVQRASPMPPPPPGFAPHQQAAQHYPPRENHRPMPPLPRGAQMHPLGQILPTPPPPRGAPMHPPGPVPGPSPLPPLPGARSDAKKEGVLSKLFKKK